MCMQCNNVTFVVKYEIQLKKDTHHALLMNKRNNKRMYVMNRNF